MAKKKKKDERAFWTLDAETDPFKHNRVPKPFIWGLYTGSSMHYMETVEEVVEAIKDQDVLCYAHNGGKFDFHLEDRTSRLFDHINLHEEMKIINGRLVSAKIGKCEIRDSWNLLPAPLREFGSKLDIDYKKLERTVRAKHMPEIKKYLGQDCIGLWNGIDGFERTYGRHLTQAGAAMAQWEKISQQKAPKTDAGYFHKFQAYYYGGRVQCFEKGYIKGPLGVWDIRSAYPRAMLDEHPYSPTYLEIAYPRQVMGADMVTLDCISAGALPFRDERGIITYPRDNIRRRYHVPGWEVLAATDTGSLREVEYINAIRFSALQNFGVYINHFYNLRKEHRAHGRDANAFFAKILMNSLYGKFGANPENYGNFMCVPWDEKTSLEEPNCDHKTKLCHCYTFNGKLGVHAVVRKNLDTWQEHFINVATAASITSWVRAYLWRALDKAHNPYYCDTDSIFAQSIEGLNIGEELGEWNHEGTATDLWIAGKKLYYAKGSFEKGKTEKMAAKGVRPDAKKIKRAALGHTVTVRSEAPTFTLSGKRQVYFQSRKIRMTARIEGDPEGV